LAAALLLLIAFFFAAGCAPYQVADRAAINREKFLDIKQGVARLRGLAFRAEVAVEIKNPEEMRRAFEKDLAHDFSDQKLKNISLAYGKLGLLPKGTDLKKSLVDFAAANVAGYYDPRSKKLVLPENLDADPAAGGRRDLVGEMTLAHELTHALQDQYFLLESKLGPSENDDRDLAFRALVEGDATLIGFGYIRGGIDRNALADFTRGVKDIERDAGARAPDVPKAIVEEMLFQYYGGVGFVARLLEERDWSAVNRLYAAPPLSTEQVLHPEKYFSAPDPPTRVELRELRAFFQPDWKEIENNVLGELTTRVLFEQFLSKDEARVAAEGWDGDRFVAFNRGDEVAFIWASVWDSDEDAAEFDRGYRRLLEKKYPGAPFAAAHVERRDRRVIVIEGLNTNGAKDRIEKIWQGMRAVEEPFDNPFAGGLRLAPLKDEPLAP
jgi:hypothetical protein